MATDEDIRDMDRVSASEYRKEIDPQLTMDATETKRLLDEMNNGNPVSGSFPSILEALSEGTTHTWEETGYNETT